MTIDELFSRDEKRTKKLYDTLTGIQWGRVEDPYHWIKILK